MNLSESFNRSRTSNNIARYLSSPESPLPITTLPGTRRLRPDITLSYLLVRGPHPGQPIRRFNFIVTHEAGIAVLDGLEHFPKHKTQFFFGVRRGPHLDNV